MSKKSVFTGQMTTTCVVGTDSIMDKLVKSRSYTPETDTTVRQLYFTHRQGGVCCRTVELPAAGNTNHYKTTQRPPKGTAPTNQSAAMLSTKAAPRNDSSMR